MEDFTGKIVKAYAVKERLGAGGFGAVYRAIQQGIEREVAIKIILPEHANRPEFVRRFETEAQLVARLEHPHIVPLYDYWRDPDGAYLVMRYLRGGSMRDSLSLQEQWTVGRVTAMLAQISSALAFAHNSGVIHRDLKSDNIIMDEAGNSYLTDFGIAKDLGGNANLTKDAILGTPAYLSPEQIRGLPASSSSDVYALGIVVYEALAGIVPFYDETPATVLFRQLTEPLPHVTNARPDLPDAVNAVLMRATAKEPEERYATVQEFAREFQRAVQNILHADEMPAATTQDLIIFRTDSQLLTAKNPYKGLRAFQQADAADFYGRNLLIERLLARLKEPTDNHDFLAVVGPSGSGKSSVVKAGLLPAIRQGMLDDTHEWYITEIVPGTHPLEEVEAALLGLATSDVPNLMQQLRDDTRGFIRAAKRILPDENARLVLVIDQFEEVFTLLDSEEERQHFLDMVLAAVNDPRSRIYVIITLRADFYDRPLLYSGFGDLIRRRTELVLPLSPEELEAAIVAPATRVGVKMEPALVAAILKDVNQQPGALPLLQYALTELFERREGRLMTIAAYHEIGGTSGALARRADEVYSNFDTATQETVRQLFLRLVTPGEGAEDTRRRVLQSELLSITDTHNMRRVLDTFGKYRLLTFDNDPQTRSSTVEVAHEALIRKWERMRDWLEESREGLRLQRRLQAAADDWQRANRNPAFLATGLRLQQFENRAEMGGIALTDAENEYLNASVTAREAAEAADRAREERERRLEKQARQRLRVIAAVMAFSAIIGSVLAVIAFNQREAATVAQADALTQAARAENNAATATIAQGEAVIQAGTAVAAEAEALISASTAVAAQAEAQTEARFARSLALAASARNIQGEGNLPLALALAIEANNVYAPPAAEVFRVMSSAAYALGIRARYTDHTAAVTSVDYSKSGRYFLSSSLDGTINIYSSRTGLQILEIPIGTQFVTDATFHPDESKIAASMMDGTIRIYSFNSGEELLSLGGHVGGVTNLDFSPDGRYLASGGEDRSIRLWDIQTGEEVRQIIGHPGAIYRIAFSPDGTKIASTSADATFANDPNDTVDRTVRLWDVETGEQLLLIEPKSGFVRSLDYSPDGTKIAIGVWDTSNGGTLRLYDTNTGEEVQRLFVDPGILIDVVFSADGRFVATTGWEGNVGLWDLRRSLRVATFIGFEDRILTMAYSPNGESLLVGSGNFGDNLFALDNERSIDTSLWLIDLKNRDEIRTLSGHTDWVWTVALNLDGSLAATGSGPLRPPAVQAGQEVPKVDYSVRVWNVPTGQEVQRMEGHSNTVDSVIFHPTAQRVLSGSWDSNIILWDVQTADVVRLYRSHTDRVYDLAFNRDGTRFLSASADDTIMLWDAEGGQVVRQFAAHEGDVNSVTWSPDFMTFASGSADGTIRIWDVATGEVLRVLNGHTASVNEVRFSPDGALLASSSWDDTVRLWEVTTGRLIREITGHNGNTFGLAFSSDGLILLTTSQDTSVRMWEVATGEELHRFNGHFDWVQEVVISPDGKFAISAAQDRTARIWRIDRTTAELTTFARANRYIRELTCQERELYRLTQCEVTDGGR